MPAPISRRILMQGSTGAAALSALPIAAQGAADQNGVRTLIRLHLNENPHGPSDRAKQAMRAALDDGWAYDNEDALALRRVIAAKEGLKPENIFICEGSTELLKVAALLYAGNGKDMVAGLPTFLAMPQYASRNGGQVKWANLDAAHRLDLNAMEALVGSATGAVYICNPNNPTGTVVDSGRLRSFVESVSKRALVVVDEAYIDLADDPDRTTMVDQVKLGRNVLISRTFSKIHGLAGLRVGYGLGRPDVIRRLEEMRVSVPNRMGLKAAMASYQDSEFLDYSRSMVRGCVTYTCEFLKSMQLPYIPTEANFVMFDTGGSSVDFALALRAKSIYVQPMTEPFNTWARVSMGRLEHMEAFAVAARAHFKKS